MNEKVIETKICKCGMHFDITDLDLEFYDKVSPVFGGVKYLVPSPTLCPECRFQRRLSFRNERYLYKGKCGASGKNIVSMFSPDKNYKIFSVNEWWSDKWNPLEYGIDYNFKESFSSQWQKLFEIVPKACVGGMSNENSEYTNFVMYSKDCYLIASGRNNEKCFYSRNIRECQNAIDCLQITQSEYLYDVVSCVGCTNILHSFHVINCRDSSYLYFCEGCDNCFGCINLTNKSYYILNKPYSQEEYFLELERLKSVDKLELEKNIKQFFLSKPRRALNIYSNEGNITFDYIRNSRDIKNSSFIAECHDISYSFELEKSHDIYDCCMGGGGNQFVYESVAIGMNEYKNAFCVTFTNLQSSLYCESCYNSTNLFGCIGLRNAQYCILNKQYTKEEYEILAPKIIEHMISTKEWGEFFPSSISPFGYNETVAMEYYPIEKPTPGSTPGWKWSDYENPVPQVSKTIPANKLPDDIKDIPDDIINWAITCEISGKPFRIIKQELNFYRKHSVPVPRRHPDQRHLDRMKLRNPRKLYNRNCDKCGVDIKTTYSPDREEIVYCEECYNREVI